MNLVWLIITFHVARETIMQRLTSLSINEHSKYVDFNDIEKKR